MHTLVRDINMVLNESVTLYGDEPAFDAHGDNRVLVHYKEFTVQDDYKQ